MRRDSLLPDHMPCRATRAGREFLMEDRRFSFPSAAVHPCQILSLQSCVLSLERPAQQTPMVL